jgi:hypothetical protein
MILSLAIAVLDTVIVPDDASGSLLHWNLTLESGTKTIRFRTDAPAVPNTLRDLHLQVNDLSIGSQ